MAAKKKDSPSKPRAVKPEVTKNVKISMETQDASPALALWFDQYFIHETDTHHVIQISNSITEHIFQFALSKHLIHRESFSLESYLIAIADVIPAGTENLGKLTRPSPTGRESIEVLNVRHIGVSRLGMDAEISLYKFGTLSALSHKDGDVKIKALPIATLHSYIAVQYNLLMDLFEIRKNLNKS